MAAKSKKPVARTATKHKPATKAAKPAAAKKSSAKAPAKKAVAKAAPKAAPKSVAVVYASALREMIAKRLGRA
jgi:hypothetical protein